jgi:hypothetical protein
MKMISILTIGAILKSHWHNFIGQITDLSNGFAYMNVGVSWKTSKIYVCYSLT